jgi:hypothetical protein
MRIARLVTTDAANGCIAELDRLRVTRAARDRSVGISQLEVRECVIERFPVELDDVSLSSRMVGMAIGAFGLHGIRPTTVKSPTRRTVSRYFLVASNAQARLRLS